MEKSEDIVLIGPPEEQKAIEVTAETEKVVDQRFNYPPLPPGFSQPAVFKPVIPEGI